MPQGQSNQPAEKIKINVLVVEDDPPTRDMLAVMLDMEKITAVFADSPLTAAEHLGMTTLVLSDVQMPGGGVVTLAEQMHAAKEAGKDPGKLLAMTANTELAEKLRSGEMPLAYPIAQVLLKPFDYDQLLTMINEQLETGQSPEDTPSDPGLPPTGQPPEA